MYTRTMQIFSTVDIVQDSGHIQDCLFFRFGKRSGGLLFGREPRTLDAADVETYDRWAEVATVKLWIKKLNCPYF
jgi:hypothetical protein